MRSTATWVLALALAGCGGASSLRCDPCTVDADCTRGQLCLRAICIEPGQDPRRCPNAEAVTGGTGSSGPASSSGAASGSASGSLGSSSTGGTGASSSSAGSSASSSASGSTTSGASTSSSSSSSATSSSSSTTSTSGTSTGTTGGSTGTSTGAAGSTSGSTGSSGPVIDRLQLISGNTVIIDPLTDGTTFDNNGSYSIRAITIPPDVAPLEVHFLEDTLAAFAQRADPYDLCDDMGTAAAPCPTFQGNQTNLANGSHQLKVEITNASGSVIYSSVQIQFDVY